MAPPECLHYTLGALVIYKMVSIIIFVIHFKFIFLHYNSVIHGVVVLGSGHVVYVV